MNTDDEQWIGRSVLILGCGHPLGRAVARILVSQGAEVIGLISHPNEGHLLHVEHRSGRFWPVYGRANDVFRLYSAIAVHDVSAVFFVSGPPYFGHGTLGQRAVRRALNLYCRRVVLVRNGPIDTGPSPADTTTDPLIPCGTARFEELFGSGGLILGTATAPSPDELRTPHQYVSDQRRDHVFLDDAARAMLLVAEQLTQGGTSLDITFRSGWTFTASEWQQLLEDVKKGSESDLHVRERAQGLPGWKPTRSLIETLREALRHPVGLDPGLNASHTTKNRRKAA